MEKRLWQISGQVLSGGARAGFFSGFEASSLALVLCALSALCAQCALAAVAAAAIGLNRAPQRSKLSAGAAQAHYDRLPLAFEPNQGQRGQAKSRSRFLAHAGGYSLFLTNRGVVFSPFECGAAVKRGDPCWLRLEMLGANPAPIVRGERQLPGRANYFIGRDPRDWRTGIPLYARVAYENVYPGVVLVYYGSPQQLEYDFVVAPYADPARIGLQFEGPRGALALQLNRAGDLEAVTSGAQFRVLKPVVFQARDGGGRQYVQGRYVIESRGRVGLVLGAYDHSQPLVIDPAIAYSTYLGGTGGDNITAIAVDGSGNAYVTGSTGSTNFPTQNPEQKAIAGVTNAFVSELNPTGTALVYSTYVGGSKSDKGTGIALDSSGNAYVAGYTSSPDFPVSKTGVVQSTYKGAGNNEAFVLKLNSGGAALGYATYLGGSGGDFAYGIAVDGSGNAYVAGSTQSADFPVSNPMQKNLAGGTDAFVAKINPQGASLVYSTFLGGALSDSAQAIALDSAGEATVAGFTLSQDFPTVNPAQAASGGGSDAFVARLNAAGSALVYSTYLGGSGEDKGLGIAVDGSGDAFVTGSTQSPNFPTSGGAYQTQPGGGVDAFVAELNASGGRLYSTLLGGSANDQGNAVAVDGAGNAYVTGSTSSPNFPTLNPVEGTLGEGACGSPCSNAFVTVLNPQGTGLVSSTFLGGNGPDYGQAIAVGSSGNAYVAGITSSSLFPVTGGAIQGTFSGSANSSNGFVAEISPGNSPALAVNPQSVNFGNQALGVTSAAQTVTLTNVSSAAVSLSGVSFSDPEFAQPAQGGTCGSTLAPGGTQCTILITFTPSSSASTTTATTGTMSINDNANGNPQKVNLSGTGATPGPGITFSPSPLNFPASVFIGNSLTDPAPVTLTNSGTAALSITKVAISGAFTETDNCVTTLQPSQGCAIQVTFGPTTSTSSNSSSTGSTSTGVNTASITITSNIPSTTTAPTETVNATALADFSLSSTGPSGVTLVSATSAAVTVGAAAVPGAPSFNGSITPSCSSEVTCTFNPTTITPGQTTTMTVTGPSGGLATAGANPVTFTLTGTSGTQTTTLDESIALQTFTLSGAPALATVNAGQTATYSLAVASVNGFNGAIALTCSNGLPAGAACSFSPATVTAAPGAPQTTALTISTTAHKGSSFAAPGARPPDSPGGPWHNRVLIGLIWLVLLASLGATLAAHGRRRAWLALGLLLAAALLLAGCNMGYYGFIGSNPAPTGSPSGVYTVTVAGTYTPASGTTGQTTTSQSTTVNLAVQ